MIQRRNSDAALATPMRQTIELGTDFWNDSCDLGQLREAVAEVPEAEREVALAESEEADSEPARKVRHSPQRPPSTTAPDSLTKELRMIEAARRALASGDGGGALQQLNDYAHQYPKGSLRAEAGVLRIEALMAKGDRGAAARLGKAYLRRSPNGPYARRIRSVLERGGVAPTP